MAESAAQSAPWALRWITLACLLAQMWENKTARQVLAVGKDLRALAQWVGVTSSRLNDALGHFPQAAWPLVKVVWDAFRGFPFQMWS